MKQEYIRCFVSIDLPNEIKDISKNIQNELKNRNLVDAAYTSQNNLHLTLKFLGEIDNSTLKIVMDKLKKVNFDKFNINLGETGVFSEDVIRIIWLSLEDEVLHKLQKDIDDSLKGMFKNEFRFMAHITIARVKTTFQKDELLDYLKSIKLDEKKYEINEFALKKSILTNAGPIYEDIEGYPAQNFK
jgi:RNA 2',3'-cyclic 3'-phosphodiesterase